MTREQCGVKESIPLRETVGNNLDKVMAIRERVSIISEALGTMAPCKAECEARKAPCTLMEIASFEEEILQDVIEMLEVVAREIVGQ